MAESEVILVIFGDYSVYTTVTASEQVASSWVNEVLEDYCPSGGDWVKVIGFAVESEPNLLPGDNHPIAILQLCIDDICLIFQLLHCNSVIPPALHSFLDDPRFIFVGVDVDRDADRLWREHRLLVTTTRDLRDAVALYLERPDLLGADMERLVWEVTGVEMERPVALRTSGWQHQVLSLLQIAFACADAFASFKLGETVFDRLG